MKAYLKHKDNESAVSPIVATLVLIVVAVVGAVAVGTIMGAFSDDVSDQTNSGNVAGSAQTEILISGSTTVQPASELLAKEYMKDNSGVKVTVMGGGSDAGLAAINLQVVDIGAASKLADSTKYPDLVGHQIGGSAVVWIGNGITGEVSAADLQDAYEDCADGETTADFGNIPEGTTMYQRAEGSGTEETAAEFLGYSDKSFDTTDAATATGNAGVLAAVQGNDQSIGFVDFGYAVEDGNAAVDILAIDADGDGTADGHVAIADGASASTLQTNILTALKGDETFPTADSTEKAGKYLTRPLMYYTYGEPSGIVKDYIAFAMSPAGQASVEDAGAFHIISFL